MTGTATEPKVDLRGERDRFVAFSFAAADLLLEIDQDGRIRFVSGAARALTGRDTATLMGQSYKTLFVPDDRRFVAVLLERLSNGNRLEPVIVHLVGSSGRSIPAVLGGCRLPSHQGALFLTFSAPRQPPLHKGRPMPRDGASGVLERESFEEAASDLVRNQGSSGKDAKLTMLRLVGIDSLRERAGAEATSTFLGEMGAFLRAVSINGDGAGRIAEDRYGVVHAATLDPVSVSGHVAALARAADPTGKGLPIDHSTVDLSLEGLTEEDAAKALIYTIGKFAENTSDRFAVDSLQDAFRTLLKDTVSRIGALRGTVSESRFDIAFQPIVDLATRQVQHYELLARLEDGKSPYALVTFAEGVGMIEEFDLAVCHRAIEFLRDKASGSMVVAVNLSGRSLESALFAEALMTLLKPHAELGPRLMFELTETTQVSALGHVNRVIQALRTKGHRFALDDFGAGSSSFPYLHSLTVDFVKIDGIYVRRMLSSPRDAAIMRSMVTLCHELGVKTIAEMIETEEQAKELRSFGVDFGQGYLFGRPAPNPAALERNRARNVAPLMRQGSGHGRG
jgi:PAS domain S-box-containing protein